ncbi:hypothetical protein KIN20_023851, partial [Parelaphostrongylus tenuis]
MGCSFKQSTAKSSLNDDCAERTSDSDDSDAWPVLSAAPKWNDEDWLDEESTQHPSANSPVTSTDSGIC